MSQLELLAPAGDFERLIAAIDYGADAVYLAGEQFGMRAASKNFDRAGLAEAVTYAHARDVSVYLTCNTLPQNNEIAQLPDFLQYAATVGVDACIVGDIGVLMLLRQYAPQMQAHVSTQAGIMNYQTAIAFYELGARRIVLARELSIDEIAEIRAKIPPDMQIEAFVHGAMCMSISGRCLISDYMTGRSANKGACAQPCRWEYHLVEKNHPQQQYTIGEDQQGSFLLNAKDLCMIEHLDKLAQAGVTSFKIEGRAKSAYYVAVITNAYHLATLHYMKNPAHFTLPPWLLEEVCKVSHRPYSTGFYFGTPDQYEQNGGYQRNYDVIAVVLRCENGVVFCTQKNKCYAGDTVEILSPKKRFVTRVLNNLQDQHGNSIDSTPHAQMLFSFEAEGDFKAGSLLRKQTT